MHMSTTCAVILSLSVGVTMGSAQSIPAFPGAQGPGGYAPGGRGGDVYHVTNLEADKDGVIPGSLMYGIKTAPSTGRIIVFDVGGTIYHDGTSANERLRPNRGNITIAGQTAPGPGITIAGTGTKWTGENVILRNISVRPGLTTVTHDAFDLQLKNSIVDHVSASWFTDEGISITDAGENTTIQYANISEGLHYAGHSYGSIIATEVDGTHYSFRHNLYAHNSSRMPRLGSATGQIGAVTDFTNNVLYNWGSNRAGYSGTNQPSRTNFINNYYINGPSSTSTELFRGGDSSANANDTRVYESGNKLDRNRNGVIDGVVIGGTAYFTRNLTLYAEPFQVDGVAAPESADLALQRVLDYGGANWWNRSPIDQRIYNSVRNGTGQVIDDLSGSVQAAEWAALMAERPDGSGNAPYTRPANWDTDGDGMPDHWEIKHGLDPLTPNHNGDFDNDGYTDLEEYINEIAAWPAPQPIVFTGATSNRYAQITNWDLTWQPSHFDEAHINVGTAVVDAVGQHARVLRVATSQGQNATLSVTGGWIEIAETLVVGSGGVGTVNQTGGIVAADKVILGELTNGSGTYNLSGGVLTTSLLAVGASGGSFNFSGGVLHADVIGFSLTNNGGTLAPGNSIGHTEVLGDLLLNEGVLQIEIDGLMSDTVGVAGMAVLGGALEIIGLDGFMPQIGDFWTILIADQGVFGSFDSITDGYIVQTSGNSLVLQYVPEPGLLGLLGFTGLALLRRRRG